MNTTPSKSTGTSANINNFIRELYSLKSELREADKWPPGERSKLYDQKNKRKNILLLDIRRELAKISKAKANKIKKKLWNELGVVV